MTRYPTWLLGEPEKLNGVWNPLDLIYLGDDSIHIVDDVVVMRLHAQRTDGGAPAADRTADQFADRGRGSFLP